MAHLNNFRKRLSHYKKDSLDEKVTTRSSMPNFIIMEAPHDLREVLDDFLIDFSYPSKVRKTSSGSLQFIIKL